MVESSLAELPLELVAVVAVIEDLAGESTVWW